jgi:hypothetical protein
MLNRPGKDSPSSGSSAQKGAKAAAEERRGASRHAFVLNAEAEDLGAGIKLPARVSDLSVYGCYLDTLNPFPAGTRTRIRLWKGNENFLSFAVVIYSHDSMGMGVAFTDVTPAAQETLQNWLGETAGRNPSERPSDSTPGAIVEAKHNRTKSAQIERLVQIFVSKGLLTSEEARRILS